MSKDQIFTLALLAKVSEDFVTNSVTPVLSYNSK